jgi:hypothetical protein
MFRRGDIVRHIPSGQLAEFAAYDADTLHARVECFTDDGDYAGSRVDRVEAFEPAPDAGLKTPSWFRQQLAAEREARQRAEALLYRGCHDCAYDARSRSADQCDGCAVWAGLVAAGIEAPDPGADQDGTAQAPAADWDSGIATLDDTQYRCF